MRSNFMHISAKVKQQLSGIIPEGVVDKEPWLTSTAWSGKLMPSNWAASSVELQRVEVSTCLPCSATAVNASPGSLRSCRGFWMILISARGYDSFKSWQSLERKKRQPSNMSSLSFDVILFAVTPTEVQKMGDGGHVTW